MRDRSAPVKEEMVRQNTLSVVRVTGGDDTDPGSGGVCPLIWQVQGEGLPLAPEK